MLRVLGARWGQVKPPTWPEVAGRNKRSYASLGGPRSYRPLEEPILMSVGPGIPAPFADNSSLWVLPHAPLRGL